MSYICVADANILFSAILNPNGTNARILSLYAEKLCTCDFVFQELQKYEAIFIKRNRNRQEYMQQLVGFGLVIYPDEFVQDQYNELYTMMNIIDIKDILYVSLAKKLHIPLWTLDKKLLETQLPIECLDTGEIMKLFS